ncbi:hypothetical protein [Cryobacterium sp. PAMC25264]|uniref:hypothetical protein n=1 Tax=Cryobacterium sp. PAMC25264 TaxID=2861288 RepID=UPI001C6291F9|nr:hypothetical protein [Cryobacterium sp. PAMC25264]QYF72692.1 hypothetical protein KY500_12880 [Cryobacterium sp. PAMC25264]
MKFAEANLSIVLPGSWLTLPLDDPPTLERQIASVVKRRIGRDDRLARLRRDAKEQLRGMAAAAAAAGAFRVALSLEILPGVPFPAAMVLDYSDWPPTAPGSPVPADDTEQRLRLAFPGAELLSLDSGLAVRRAFASTIRAGEETTNDVKIQYWLVTPDDDKLLHIVVDAPMASDTELYTQLFDAIVDSVRFSGIAVAAS